MKTTTNPILSVGSIPDAREEGSGQHLPARSQESLPIWLAWACCPFFTQDGCFESAHRKKRERKGELKETEVKAKERKRSKEQEEGDIDVPIDR